MTLQEKHFYECNKLAFKFACVIQLFEVLSTIMYQKNRVGFLSTPVMLILQIIAVIITVVGYMAYGKENKGKIMLFGGMFFNYFIVMLGSVHVPYLWAFGPGLLIMSLLFSDTDSVESCVDANTKVMDAISNLSATSEEVAASSTSSIEISQDCEMDMNTTKEILQDILKISRQSTKN